MSESSDYWYASSVCSKNDGERHILEVQEILFLYPGKNTALYSSRQDKKRAERAEKAKQLSSKVRQNFFTNSIENIRKKMRRLKACNMNRIVVGKMTMILIKL